MLEILVLILSLVICTTSICSAIYYLIDAVEEEMYMFAVIFGVMALMVLTCLIVIVTLCVQG